MGILSGMSAFPEDLARRIGSVDIIVAVPCYNEAATVGGVVEAVGKGLSAHFPDRSSVLLVSDGGSDDGTIEVAERAEVPLPVEKAVVVHSECPGKGTGLRVLFDAARDVSAKACATFDADLRNITPEWVRLMLEPVLRNGFEYVAPYYRRDRYDATITNNICYPIMRALLGSGIRQPIGGDFAFSGDLARYFSGRADEEWNDDIAHFGIDIWMTARAVGRGARVCQSFLGAKVHSPKDPFRLKGMFTQVVATLFDAIRETRVVLKPGGEVSSVPTFGEEFRCEPGPVEVSREELRREATEGRERFAEVWDDVLSPGHRMDIEDVFDAEGMGRTAFTPTLWAGVVYDFLYACCLAADREWSRGVVDAMAPIYCAKVLSFVEESEHMTDGEVEAAVEVQAREFERQAPEVIGRIGP